MFYFYFLLLLLFNEIRLLLYDIFTVTLRFSHGFATKSTGYNTNHFGAVTQSFPMSTKNKSYFDKYTL